jgi:2-haloacid dehalogenase
MAARELGVSVDGMRLIAAHAWDVAGALRAGATAGFVARPGMVLDPLAPAPDVIGADLAEVAEQLISVDLS